MAAMNAGYPRNSSYETPQGVAVTALQYYSRQSLLKITGNWGEFGAVYPLHNSLGILKPSLRHSLLSAGKEDSLASYSAVFSAGPLWESGSLKDATPEERSLGVQSESGHHTPNAPMCGWLSSF